MELGDLDVSRGLLDARQAYALRLLPERLPHSQKGLPVNERYRKQMRLRSRHFRKGHTPFCKCREPWQMVGIKLRRQIESGEPLPVRKIRLREPSGR